MGDRLIVVGALISDGDRFLMTQRYDSDPSWPGCWEFPGGKVEPGESDQAALERELQEELGIDVRAGEQFIRVEVPRPDGRLLDFRVLRCVLRSGTPQPLEVQAIRWVDLDEAQTLAVPRADEPVLSRIGSDGLDTARLD